MAKVISQIGTDVTHGGPVILVVAEIENDSVLTDLRASLKTLHYPSFGRELKWRPKKKTGLLKIPFTNTDFLDVEIVGDNIQQWYRCAKQ